jgi:predicted dehydrogenase
MDAPMKVAVIGSGRKRNGIGEFIAKYFHLHGAIVSCVLGSTDASSSIAAANLAKYGIRAQAYSDFSNMISCERPDAVAIASPVETHIEFVKKCLEAGVHIFCEKPFVSPEQEDSPAFIERSFAEAEESSLIIALNSQWPFCLPSYEELCGKIDLQGIERFYIRLSPLSTGREMIPDSVPHALSLLHFVAGSGEIRDLTFSGNDQSLALVFSYLTRYGNIEATVELVRETEQPRTFDFGFNERIVHRIIDPGSYTIYLTHKDKIIKIADPLELSVRDFLDAVSSGREPALGKWHIMETASLLRDIYTAYRHT